MIKNFGNRAAKEIWENSSSKAIPKELWLRAKALLTIMHSTSTINDLKIKGQPPNIRLHKLKGDRKDEWSVTIKLPTASPLNLRMVNSLILKLKTITKDRL